MMDENMYRESAPLASAGATRSRRSSRLRCLGPRPLLASHRPRIMLDMILNNVKTPQNPRAHQPAAQKKAPRVFLPQNEETPRTAAPNGVRLSETATRVISSATQRKQNVIAALAGNLRRHSLGALFVLFFLTSASAHVGSPDVFLEGSAGPYRLFVTIRVPQVIPGIAQIEIRSEANDVREIRIAPMQ